MLKILEKKRVILLLIVVVMVLFTVVNLLDYDDDISELVNNLTKVSKPQLPTIDAAPVDGVEQEEVRMKISDYSKSGLVIFPNNFPLSDEELGSFYETLGQPLPKLSKLIRYIASNKKSKSMDTGFDESQAYHLHKFQTFLGTQDIGGDFGKCNAIEQDFEVQVSELTSLDVDVEELVRFFMNSGSSVYKEVAPIFEHHIPYQFKGHTIAKHWYRLAGTSVWLEQYGVHFMISRLIYSKSGFRNQPAFSVTYCQVFNERWEELKNVELVLPTNGLEDLQAQGLADGIPFTKVSYPMFLSVPSYYNDQMLTDRYYGPEDPRLLLVKNEKGYEEPLMVYNSYHRKIVNVRKDTEEAEKIQEGKGKLPTKFIEFAYYRSMFMCFPWQFQKGKRVIDEVPNEQYDTTIYNKAVELKKVGEERSGVQKNWTPFIDFEDRKLFSHDKFIYFVFRWEDLEILRCDLYSYEGTASGCIFVFKTYKTLPPEQKVGPLRGGTELINLNALAEENDLTHYIKIPEGYEILFGFARAHLDNCGCGSNMYRPNLVVIIKDVRTKTYKIDLVSSFVSLDVNILGWDLDHPEILCKKGDSDALIPNGIGSLAVKRLQDSYEDYTSLVFSRSDATVDVIHMKGLFPAVLNSIQITKNGYDNSNIACALRESKRFCRDYGKRVRASKIGV